MSPVARTLAVLSSAGLAAVASAVIGTSSAAAAPVPGVTPAPPPEPAAAAATPCAPTVKACFSTSQRKAWLTDGAGHVTYGPVPALGGTAQFPTPTGTFRVSFKDAHHVSNLFNPGSMPNSVFFAPAVAFHQGSLGQRSHGCVHLSPAASQRFFGALRPGDVVQVVR